MRDRRTQLKIKIKSLAEEAKMIKKEEKKKHPSFMLSELNQHRIFVVKKAIRESLIAYGFIRNREYSAIESNPQTPPDWKEVERLVSKYGKAEYYDGEDNGKDLFAFNDKLIDKFRLWSGRPTLVQTLKAKFKLKKVKP